MRITSDYIFGLQQVGRRIDLDTFRNKSFLVTGATGLIGSAICDLLLQLNSDYQLNIELYGGGRNVDKLAARFEFFQSSAFHPVFYDATSEFVFNTPVDFIIHCAGLAHPAAYRDLPVEVIQTTVNGTSNMLNFARRVNATRLLYVSSSEIYGSRDGQAPFVESESHPIDLQNPRSCYPISKRLAENLCTAYFSEYGVQSVIARPGHVYGPTALAYDSRAHTEFALCAHRGEDIVLKSTGAQRRSYIYSTDAAAALLLILIKGKAATPYNVGVPETYISIRELAETFARCGGVKVKTAIPSAKEASAFNPMSTSALDCSLLKKLGFEATFSLESGVLQTLGCLD